MRFTRKTIMALSVSGALTLVAGVSASAAVLGLPILGFGEAASEPAAPQVVHQTVYDDHYVTATTTPKAATSASAATARSGGSAPTAAVAPSIPGPGATAGPGPAAAAPAAVAAVPAAPTTAEPDPPATTVPAPRIPPPPAGCREPEWDREHQVWQCSNDEVGG